MRLDLLRSGRPGDALVGALHYLELGCQDVEATGAFYERALGYRLSRRSDDLLVASGPDRHLVLVPGKPRSLVSAGYAVRDRDVLDRLRERIVAAGARAEDGATPLFEEAVTVHDPDGNRFSFGVVADDADEQASGPAARLQHVVMASRDPAAIVRFFVDVLGFTLSDDVLDDEGGVRTSFLRSSQEHHSFAVFKAPENRLDHHCYETNGWNDIRDWADHMASGRIKIQWGPGRHGPGNNLFFFVHDPDGNWVELSAELEVVDHDREVGKWAHEEHTLNSWGQGLLRS